MINIATDLDGTIYIDNKLIPGVAEVYKRLINKGVNVYFITNNSSQSPNVIKSKLENLLDSDIEEENIITPLLIFKTYFQNKQKKYYAHGSEALINFLIKENYNVVNLENCEIILIGRKEYIDNIEVQKIIIEITKGKKVYCFNRDISFPSDGKELPGNGAVVKIIEDELGILIDSFGKPDSLYLKYFNDNNIKLDYVVGDRVDTDIYLGNKLNSTSILVDSGVVNFASDKNADFKLNSFSEIESVVF